LSRIRPFSINALKTKMVLNCIQRFRSYGALDTISVVSTNQLKLCREIVAVCFEIHTKHINTLCGKGLEFFSVTAGEKGSNFWSLRVNHNTLFVRYIDTQVQ
jgi:hypothetical protein